MYKLENHTGGVQVNRMFFLDSFIDIDFLQELQDNFSKATGVAAVTVDYAGKPINRRSNFTRFCSLIRENPIWREECHRCDAYGGLEAARLEKPYIYKCHAGLVDISMPIILKGKYVGAILAGQAKIEDEKYKQLPSISIRESNWQDDEEIVKAYNEIEILTYDKVAAAAHMMFVISNYIVEKELINLVQEELNKKNVELMEEMKIRSNLEKSLKESEIKALYAQINPHFLFNVLNTITRLALFENANKTQEIAFCFSELLRYTLKKKQNREVALKEELTYIENYLKIQTVRFGDRLKYEICVDEDINDNSILFMILQPIVENALNHGIGNLKNGGNIQIKGYKKNDDVYIEILDNGVGMNKEKIRDIFSANEVINEESVSTGLGMNNVNKRLIYYYGEDYNLKVDSKVNQGTKVTIRIPNIRILT